MSKLLTYGIMQQRKSFPYFLDSYTGAVVAFSLRKLRSAYSGYCMRVRRSSDNAELDIGFRKNGVVDLAAINTFCAGSIPRIANWYDQSGNNRDLTSNANYNYLEFLNFKPAIKLQSENFVLSSVAPNIFLDSNYKNTVIEVAKRQTHMLSCGEGIFDIYYNYGASTYYDTGNTTTRRLGAVIPVGTPFSQKLHIYYSNGNNAYVRWNGVQLGTGSVSGTPNISTVRNFIYYGNTNYFSQELIIYNADKSGDLSGIENNINEYYNIY